MKMSLVVVAVAAVGLTLACGTKRKTKTVVEERTVEQKVYVTCDAGSTDEACKAQIDILNSLNGKIAEQAAALEAAKNLAPGQVSETKAEILLDLIDGKLASLYEQASAVCSGTGSTDAVACDRSKSSLRTLLEIRNEFFAANADFVRIDSVLSSEELQAIKDLL